MQDNTDLMGVEDGLVVEQPRPPFRQRLSALLIRIYIWLFGTAAGYRVRFCLSVLMLPWAVASLFTSHWVFTLVSVIGLVPLSIGTSQLIFAWCRGHRWFLDNWSERMDYLSLWLLVIGVWIL